MLDCLSVNCVTITKAKKRPNPPRSLIIAGLQINIKLNLKKKIHRSSFHRSNNEVQSRQCPVIAIKPVGHCTEVGVYDPSIYLSPYQSFKVIFKLKLQLNTLKLMWFFFSFSRRILKRAIIAILLNFKRSSYFFSFFFSFLQVPNSPVFFFDIFSRSEVVAFYNIRMN